jgi:hypothetical protein
VFEWHYNDSVVIDFDQHPASLINSFFGSFMFAETNVSSAWLIRIKLTRSDVTILFKKTSQILLGKSLGWKVLHV